MNVSEAKSILNLNGSTHEHKNGKYYADFSIKVYSLNLPQSLTAKEREYIESVDDPYEDVRGALLNEIDAIAPAMITGRSGGWITVEWYSPEEDTEIIVIAETILEIKKLRNKALDFIRTEEFWLDFVEGIDPTRRENYNPKTKLITSIVMYADKTFGVVLTMSRGMEDRKYYYHEDGNVARLLAVLNSDAYDQQVKLGKVEMFIYFEKKKEMFQDKYTPRYLNEQDEW